jgi:hypothetical protein
LSSGSEFPPNHDATGEPVVDTGISTFLLGLQSTIGNAAVARLIENGGLLSGTGLPPEPAAESCSG